MSNPLWTPDTNIIKGIVAYWELDEGSGNRADATGNGHTLTSNNAAPSGVGFIGNGVSLNGTNQFLSIASGSAGAFQPSGASFSVRARVNFNTVTGEQDIFGIFTTTGNQRSWLLNLSSATTFRFSASPDGTNASVLTLAGTTPVSGTWYDLYGGVDAVAGKVWICLDAGPIQTATFTGPVFSGSAPLIIGAVNAGGFGRVNGVIDTVGFWNRVLLHDEIRHLHQSRTYPFV